MADLLQPGKIAAQALSDVAVAAAAGVLLHRLWLGAHAGEALMRRLHAWLIASAAVMLGALAMELLVLSAIMTGSANWSAIRSALPDVAGTEAGHALAAALCGVLPLLLLSIVPSVMRRRWMVIGAIVLVAAVLLSRTPLGHAASDGPWTLREAVQFVHLVSVCVWGGGVLIAGLVVLPGLSSLEDAPVAVSVAGRLSRTVTIALVGVVLSGVYNSWRGTGGHVAPLTQTSWGEMLLAKVLLVLVALCLGARVRLMLQARSTPASARVLTMGRWMRMEAVVMIVVLILSAWLANLSPAGDMGDMAINPHGDHQVRACPLLAASEDVVA